MRLEYHVNSRYTLVAEGEDDQAVFEEMARLQETFGRALNCPRFEKSDSDKRKFSENVVFRVREVEDNKFYELFCLEKPNAKFKFGQKKKGGHLFPKREAGVDGWVVYNKETQAEE